MLEHLASTGEILKFICNCNNFKLILCNDQPTSKNMKKISYLENTYRYLNIAYKTKLKKKINNDKT